MASEIPEIFSCFWPTTQRVYVCKTVSNLGMFRFKLIYIADQVVFRRMLLLHELYITPL